MSKLYFLIGILIALNILSIALPVRAHDEESDQSIIATMHIEPADSPIANSTSTLVFIIQNSNSTFNINDCNCAVSIFKGSDLIYKTDLKELFLSFTFPQIGEYTIELRGESKVINQFSPFDLKFEAKVDTEEKDHFFHGGHWLHILIFGGGLLICLYVIIFK